MAPGIARCDDIWSEAAGMELLWSQLPQGLGTLLTSFAGQAVRPLP